jgi:putative membrane-bound dehydrogenase-like protein
MKYHSIRLPRLLGFAAGISTAMAFTAVRPAAAQMKPEETVKTFNTAEGLETTVWASEPEMSNPTNIDVDSKGRVWVLEAANYRRSITRPEGDRILILEDTKGTGVCDSVKVFYQDKSLFAPLGICVLGDKVYVAQSPNVLEFTIDPAGDKPASEPKVLFTGFGGTNHDHGVHSAVFGPDGEMYFNSGNAGGEGYIKDADGKPIVDSLGSEIGNGAQIYRGQPKADAKHGHYRDGYAFRCDLDGKNFEVLGYNFRNNFELCVDSFGTVWQSDNDDDGNQGVRINYVMEGGDFGYTGPKGSSWGRDKDAVPGQTKQEAHWHQRWPGIVPNLLHTGGGSPTGILIYEGNLLPEKFQGALIHCDAGPNVVRAYETEPSAAVPVGLMNTEKAYSDQTGPGAGFKVKEVVDIVKIKPGGDKWFRPSDVCVAPDGSLFIADWSDPGVGGHATGDTGAKDGPGGWQKLHGRIYHVTTTGTKYTVPKLDLETVPGQIAALKSPNLATRYLAWARLHEGGAEADKALEQVYATDSNSRFRARALWLLARSKDGQNYVEQALTDKDPDIRVTAVRAARLIKMDMPALAEKMADDQSPAVARELCLAMNFEPANKAVPALVKLADRYDGKDRWYLEALGIGATGKEDALLEAWARDHKNNDPEVAKMIAWRLKFEPPLGSNAPKPTTQASVTDWWAAGPFGSARAEMGR